MCRDMLGWIDVLDCKKDVLAYVLGCEVDVLDKSDTGTSSSLESLLSCIGNIRIIYSN